MNGFVHKNTDWIWGNYALINNLTPLQPIGFLTKYKYKLPNSKYYRYGILEDIIWVNPFAVILFDPE